MVRCPSLGAVLPSENRPVRTRNNQHKENTAHPTAYRKSASTDAYGADLRPVPGSAGGCIMPDRN